VTEIMWQHYVSKGLEITGASFCQGQTHLIVCFELFSSCTVDFM